MGDDSPENVSSKTSPRDPPMGEEEEDKHAQVGCHAHIRDMGFLFYLGLYTVYLMELYSGHGTQKNILW